MNCSDCKNTGAQICTVCCTYQGGVPDRWEPKPTTHYDRIISKTPEEMAEYHTKMCGCPPGNDPIFCGMATIGCKGCWLDWLKQEAE